jgi:hypothetical protein
LLASAIDMPSADARGGRWRGFEPLRESADLEAWAVRARAAVEAQVLMVALNRSTRGIIDYAAAHALEHYFCGRTGGVALELGGLDGVTWSESRVMAHAMGMGRVVIDGNPAHRSRRLARAADAVGVEAAVCNTSGSLHYIVSGPTSGVAEFMSDAYLRSFFPRVLRAREAAGGAWAQLDWNDWAAGLGLKTRPHEVACTPLQSILDELRLPRVNTPLQSILDELRLPRVNLLVLDTEGSELQILRTVDWRRTRFDLLVIEATAATSVPGYADALATYVRAASRGGYVVTPSVTRGVRGRDLWLRHREFRPSACRGLFADAPASIAARGFDEAAARPSGGGGVDNAGAAG